MTEARLVMEMELVLDAKMAELFVILSSSMNNFFFTSSDSTIASITTSAVRRSSKFEVHRRRPKALDATACWFMSTYQHFYHKH